jgi:ferredoxin
MRIVVDRELCEGNGVCERVAREVFQVGDDDLARVLVERPDAALRPKVDAAVRGCPRQAIRLVED